MKRVMFTLAASAAALALASCAAVPADGVQSAATAEARSPEGLRYLSQPLLRDIYIADPSAHVFNNRLYIYGSHDIEGTTPRTISAPTSRCATIAWSRWIGSAPALPSIRSGST